MFSPIVFLRLALLAAAWLAAGGAHAALTPSADGHTVTDSDTGLIWQRCSIGQSWDANAATCTGTHTDMTWPNAFAAVAQANASALHGHNDWRLPSMDELRSIRKTGQDPQAPTIDRVAFPATPVWYFWSGSPSPFAGYPGYAGLVSFYYGYDGWAYRDDALAVRLVRGGQSSSLLNVSATAGPGGTLSPASQGVSSPTYSSVTGGVERNIGGQLVFNLQPDPGWRVASATDTCGAAEGSDSKSLSADKTYYITGPVGAACAVSAQFELDPARTYTAASPAGNGDITALLGGSGAACAFSGKDVDTAYSAATAPGYLLPHGQFRFKATGCTPGSTVTIELHYPATAGLAGTPVLLKFGRASASATADTWFELPGATITGSAATGWQVSYQVQDNSHLDGDPADGVIVDPVALAVELTYTVGGQVSGLAGSGLTLSLNGGADLALGANDAYVFPTEWPNGSYPVAITQQPAGQTCTLSQDTATIADAAVTDVDVTCSATPTAQAVTPVPTLGEWSLMLLGLLAAGLGARRLRPSMTAR